ncbi:MAG: penicillin-binding protein 2 [Gemmatimonadota bacterium]|nr:penicillin-binding protein 2 [Gemmatimonadota bacterium]MDP7031173.1 penicillin-binding protein 2 [Gemmatimonadota bacterium]
MDGTGDRPVASADSPLQEERVRRARFLTVLLLAGVAVMGARLFQLQVLGVEEYTLRSEKNRVRREWVDAPRGLIVDRNGEVLADTRPSFTVLAVPREALPDSACVALLCSVMEMDPLQVRDRLGGGADRLPRVLYRDASFEQVSQIAERGAELPGVTVEVAHARFYPHGSLAAHAIGHVGEISEEEVASLQTEGYRAGHFLGRTGLERFYEARLRGREGERYSEVDAVGRVVGMFPGRDPVPPQPGETLELHLDARLQAVAESLLIGVRGAACLLEVETGGVLVLASAPAFDLNPFATGIDAPSWKRLRESAELPLLNRCVQAVYPPGSTFKAITAAVSLEDRIIRPGNPAWVPCRGGYQFGNRWYGCWDADGHGSLSLVGAFLRSCDAYFYQLGERFDLDSLAGHSRSAGLGSPTGIDLPTELAGNTPDTAWFDQRYGRGRWTRGNHLNLAIGQGELLVTPLQMARHAAVLATGGRVPTPRLVRSPQRADQDAAPSPPNWDLSSETWKALREGMARTVTDDEGTGRGCRIAGFMPAGKTGTAENSHGSPHAWFMGYAPADAPEVAFALIVEGGGHGGEVAVPLVRALLEEVRLSRRGVS